MRQLVAHVGNLAFGGDEFFIVREGADELSDTLAELGLELLKSDVAVFYRVVQVGGDDELGVGGMLGDELSDGLRVGEVGHLAGPLAELTGMGFFGKGSGLRDEGL